MMCALFPISDEDLSISDLSIWIEDAKKIVDQSFIIL